MPVVVVANPKGGVGKSTMATQIAGYFASKGRSVMLGDADRQHDCQRLDHLDGAREERGEDEEDGAHAGEAIEPT